MIQNRTRTPCRVEVLEDRQLLSYSFKPLAFLGDPLPGGPIGGTAASFTFDFEPGDINARGQVAFGADLSTGGEGVFLADAQGNLSAMARTGDTAPDGAILGPIFLGIVNLNDSGVAAIAIHRQNQTFPSLLELDSGLYRYNSAKRQLSAEVLPGSPAPGGGLFHGIGFQPVINNGGTIAFGAIIDTDIGPANPPGDPQGIGLGLFTVDARHNVSKVARPGDAAPEGKTFDFVHIPWINDSGDVAFTAHVQEDPCIQFIASFPLGPQIFCAESIYVRDHTTGQITPVARQGDPIPGGGTFTNAYGQRINNRGQIAFIGTFPADAGTGHLPPFDAAGHPLNNGGVFLHQNGVSIAIARPGDPMPGGGNLVTAGGFTADVGLNNEGMVSFDAVISSDADGDGREDTAMYTWKNGILTRVVGSGDVIPGVGTVRALKPPDVLDFPVPLSGSPINERGQIALQVTVEDATGLHGVLLVASPANALHTASAASSDVLVEMGSASIDDSMGELGQGTVSVFVDEFAGDFNGAERARARDAIAGLNRTLAPHGVRLHDVQSAAGADIRLSMADRSPCGAFADGVLGCEAGGDIAILRGWNWYTGSDPSGIGSSRYDLQTVLTHELGHALGLEHDVSTESVMYPTLAPGIAHRLKSSSELGPIGPAVRPEPLPIGDSWSELAPPSAPRNVRAELGDQLDALGKWVARFEFAAADDVVLAGPMTPLGSDAVAAVMDAVTNTRSLLLDIFAERLADLALAWQ